jgi:hypothetical protein
MPSSEASTGNLRLTTPAENSNGSTQKLRLEEALDRFHVMQKFGKALDEIRVEEAKRLVCDGYEPVLKRSR